MKTIKLIPSSAGKPDLFEKKVNELLEALENDEQVKAYDCKILFSDGSLLAVFQIEKLNTINKEIDKNDNNSTKSL